MFGNSLENLGKSTGECKNQHSNKFPKFLKFFENLRKSSEVFGNLRKSSGKIRKLARSGQNNISAFLSFLKSSEIFGSLRKMSENSQNDLPTIFEDFRKFSEIFGSIRKCSENFGNPWKIFKCIWRLKKFFTTFQYLTPMD